MSGAIHSAKTPVQRQPADAKSYLGSSALRTSNSVGSLLGVAEDAMDEDTPEQGHRPLGAAPTGLRPKGASQLPTPQSPSNATALVNSVNFGADSPIRHGRHAHAIATPSAAVQQATPAPLERFSSSGSLITPESSPLFSRRPRSNYVASVSPPSTPRGTHHLDTPDDLSVSTPRPSIPSTPPPRPTVRSPPSVLSSPFMESAPHTPQKQTLRRAPVASPSHVDDIFSPAASSSKSSAPALSAPIPQRPPGGEIHRLRMQMAADQAARMQETESRRPEYLRRAKRRLSDSDVNDAPSGDQENTAPALGVTDSPAKGRRITLFQETSEESFEQSLLAGGYPSYGHTPAYGEPSTPQQSTKGLSQRAADWIQQATPGFRPSTPSKDPNPDRPPNDEEQRKRRRLDAFRDHNPSLTHAKLYATEVEGRGRMLLDRPAEDVPFLNPETPTKKRSRRKKAPVTDSPSRRAQEVISVPPIETARPNWLDQSFPWSLRRLEREEDAKKEEQEKLKWIERYLERESDEDEEEDQSLGLPLTDAEEPPVRRGRGKMVPLPINPAELPRTPAKQVKAYYPSDPADARAALLSKRSVRALAFRRRQEEAVACNCNGAGDGSGQVQCDDCHRWFHLDCIGVRDIEELGSEEDPWYCRDCLGLLPVGSSSPIYVPTDDRPLTGPRRDPLFFQGAGVQESPPGLLWHTPRGVPKTPSKHREMNHLLSSRSSWADSSDVGPVTPSTATKGARIYRTPTAWDPLDEPFDPTATPSRGMRLSGPFTTPKASYVWPQRAAVFQTPSRTTDARRKLSSTGLNVPLQFANEYDGSPVRRAQPQEKIRVPRQNLDSPLASRSTAFSQIARTGSPLARGSRRA